MQPPRQRHAACLCSARGSSRLPSPLRPPPSRQGACGPTSDIPARTALRGIRSGPMWRSVWRRCCAASKVVLSALCRCQAAFGAESAHAARVFGRRRRGSCTRVVRTQQGKHWTSPHSEPLGRQLVDRRTFCRQLLSCFRTMRCTEVRGEDARHRLAVRRRLAARCAPPPHSRCGASSLCTSLHPAPGPEHVTPAADSLKPRASQIYISISRLSLSRSAQSHGGGAPLIAPSSRLPHPVQRARQS
jgi:hypothetical protein